MEIGSETFVCLFKSVVLIWSRMEYWCNCKLIPLNSARYLWGGLEVAVYNLSFSCAQVSLHCATILCKLGIRIFNVNVTCQKKKKFTEVKRRSGVDQFI